MMRGYQTKPVTISADSNHSTVGKFAGWSVRESAGSPAAATVRFRDTDASGQILAVLELPADGSDTTVLYPAVWPDGGVYVEVVTGTVEGVIYDWQ